MRKLFFLPALLLLSHLSFGQIPYTAVQQRFNLIKMVVYPDVVQLPDSVIVYPLTGLTNIRQIPGSMISGPYAEIELWIIDSKGKIIYNNITTTTPSNPNLTPFEMEYCRYMKLQSNYQRHQHHAIESIASK